MNTYQTVTRTVIMLGTLSVGLMAWQVYGPPPEELAPIVNRVVELVDQTLGRNQAEPVSPPLAEPRLVAIDDSALASLPPGSALRVDEEVMPVAYADQKIPVESTDKLLGRLHSMGATKAELKPWGAEGQTYRCQCHVAAEENPGLERHFDAISTDPRTAVEEVLAEVKRWRDRPIQ